MNTEITTATHKFWINHNRYGRNEFIVEFRPLDPKTGKPWQASCRVTDGADIEPAGYVGRPQGYSTVDLAHRALKQQIERLTKLRR